jgi:hypothetical protein
MTFRRMGRVLVVSSALLVWPTDSHAEGGLPRWEIGSRFVLVRFVEFDPDREFVRQHLARAVPSGTWTEPAIGVMLTFNVTANVAIDATSSIFPSAVISRGLHNRGGRKMHFLLGSKIGQRWHKWGIFATVQPGIMSFEQYPSLADFPNQPRAPFSYLEVLQPAVVKTIGLGGATEVYVSHKTALRLDVGDTRVLYRKPEPQFLTPDFHRNNFQVSVGVAKRF